MNTQVFEIALYLMAQDIQKELSHAKPTFPFLVFKTAKLNTLWLEEVHVGFIGFLYYRQRKIRKKMHLLIKEWKYILIVLILLAGKQFLCPA